MWNLSYGRYGSTVQLGTKARPGRPPKRRKNKKKQHRSHGGGKIAKKARNAYRIHYDLEAIPRKERLEFLQNNLHKGAWISQELIDQRRAEFDKDKKSLLNMNRAKCYVCRKKARHRHHVIPINRGGSNDPRNLAPLCLKCHFILHPWLKVNLLTAAGILPVTVQS